MSNYKDSDYIEDNDYSQLIKAFEDGYDKCQKEYEEKLRWIPVTEKMPENLEWVDCKSGVGDHYVGCYIENYGIKTGDPANITHWRSFL